MRRSESDSSVVLRATGTHLHASIPDLPRLACLWLEPQMASVNIYRLLCRD
jgi:hypothetical protein